MTKWSFREGELPGQPRSLRAPAWHGSRPLTFAGSQAIGMPLGGVLMLWFVVGGWRLRRSRS